MEGRIVEKIFKKKFEKYDEMFYDLYFEFNKDQKDFIKFRNQIGLVFMYITIGRDNKNEFHSFWIDQPRKTIQSS